MEGRGSIMLKLKISEILSISLFYYFINMHFISIFWNIEHNLLMSTSLLR